MENQEKQEVEEIKTHRVDLKTKLAFMAAFIYASFEGMTIEDAMEEAVAIENLADARAKRMKRENPVFPGSQRPRFQRKQVYNKEVEANV